MTDDEKIAHIRSQLADRANSGDMLAEDASWAIGKLRDEIARLREALAAERDKCLAVIDAHRLKAEASKDAAERREQFIEMDFWRTEIDTCEAIAAAIRERQP